MRKTLFAKRQPRRGRNVRTPFRERTKEHCSERITGAELLKRSRCYRCQHLGNMARECQNQASKDHPQAAAKSFSCPVTHLHSCTMCLLTWAFAAASKTLGGTPDTFETEADWDISNDEPATTSCQLQTEYSKFCRFGFGTRPWFDGHWSTAACGRSISCSMVVWTTS